MDAYEPIDCSLHDRFEAAAVRRQAVDIGWLEDGVLRKAVGLIEDIGAENGVEYMILDGGQKIRLDRIESFRTEE